MINVLPTLPFHFLRASREEQARDFGLFVVSAIGCSDIAQIGLELVIFLLQASEYGVIGSFHYFLLARVLTTGINASPFLSNCWVIQIFKIVQFF